MVVPRQHIVQPGGKGQVARIAACTMMSLALVGAPCAAFADDDDSALMPGRIADGTADSSSDSAAPVEATPENVTKNIKLIALETVNSFSAMSQMASFLSVSTPSDPTSPSASKLESSPVGPTVPMPVVPDPTTEEFIASICEPAREIGQERGLYASVMIAQAILESGSGSSGLSKPPNNNLFGIKGSYQGQSAYMLTSEDDGSGGKYDIMSHFRRYPSVRESLQDYADLLTRDMGDFYAPAWKANAATYVQACDYLQGHYATDTSYSSKLQGLILSYDLEQYDHPAGEKSAVKADAAGDAVFTVVDEPHPKIAFSAVTKPHRTEAAPLDVETMEKAKLRDERILAAQIARESEAQDATDPLDQPVTQGALALTATGAAAAAVGIGRRLFMAGAIKNSLSQLLGFLR